MTPNCATRYTHVRLFLYTPKSVPGSFSGSGLLHSHCSAVYLPSSMGVLKGLRAEDAETPTTHVMYHLVTKLGGVRVFHLRKVQPHSYNTLRVDITSLVVRIHIPICISY